MEAKAQMKYHHSERCFTYRIKRPMVFVAPTWHHTVKVRDEKKAGDRFHERASGFLSAGIFGVRRRLSLRGGMAS